MSNEEHLEEILYEAHQLGIIEDIIHDLKCTEICTFREEIIKRFNEIKDKNQKRDNS